MKKYQISQIVIAEELKQNEGFMQAFQDERKVESKMKILDGRELMPYLLEEIIA